jgi:hypothetical protein
MYFDTKNYLKSIRNHTTKHATSLESWFIRSQVEIVNKK